MLKIGNVVLDHNVEWVDRDQSLVVRQAELWTLGGNYKLYSKRLHNGLPITLRAEDGRGLFTQAQKVALIDMANQDGAIYDFIAESFSCLVAFRSVSGPAVDLVPLVYSIDDPVTGYYTGVVNLVRMS